MFSDSSDPFYRQQQSNRHELLDDPIYSFGAQEVATFYTASFALQMDGFSPGLSAEEKLTLRHALEQSEDCIVASCIDAVTREFVSAEGGTVDYDSLVEDPKVVELTEVLSSSDNPLRDSDAISLWKEIPDTYSVLELIPAPVTQTIVGIRNALAEMRVGGIDHHAIKSLATIAGRIGTVLFDAMERNALYGAIPPENNGWLLFSTALQGFGLSESTDVDIRKVDDLINAQHNGAAANGVMLVRTTSDWEQVKELLDAKGSQETTHMLKAHVDPRLLSIIGKHSQLNLFAA